MLYDAPWRTYPGLGPALYGLLLVARGLGFGCRGSKGLLHDLDALGWILRFRVAVARLCSAGLAVGWFWHDPWVIAMSLGVLGEEMLEISWIIEARKRAPSRSAA